MQKIENPPVANYLMGSMRYMGYSFEDSVADVIDNSISANAKNIRVLFTMNPDKLYVGILDDGHGMSDKELFHAMCYGSQSSETERDANDLGRFGLGMKSASLSQCKTMTVVSRKNGKDTAYRWDYDEVSKKSNGGKWYVLKLEAEEIENLYCFDELSLQKNGTLVLWENFDVISKASGGFVYESLTKYRNNLLSQLALTYHRFISEDGLKIFVNYAEIKALDPFLSKRSDNPWGTLRQPLMDSYGKEHFIEITPYKLPFVSEMSDDEKSLIGGDDKMNKMQGYYIYRGKRLIKFGTWFGTPRHEVSKYGRVKVDIPNNMDDIWKVDVMKRNAIIPRELSRLLEKTIGSLIEKSTKQTKFRGQPVTSKSEDFVYVWDRIESRNGFYSYRINRKNCFINALIERIPDECKTDVELLLKQIEQNIPVHQMHLDHDANRIVPDNDIDMSDLFEQAIMTVEFLLSTGMGVEVAVQKTLKCSQFKNNADLTTKIKKNYLL